MASELIRFMSHYRKLIMKTLTFILVLMAKSVGCLRFKQYPCEGFCIPGSMDSVATFTSMQCARRCLKNNDCGWFLYQEDLHQCIIDGTSCCTGWKAYYSGQSLLLLFPVLIFINFGTLTSEHAFVE